MKITTNSQQLAQELRLLNKIAAAKSTIPILSNVLFKAVDEQLTLSATDLEIAITTNCLATIHQTGSITLNAKKLLEFIEQLPSTDITMELIQHKLHLTAGTFKSQLPTIPASDFPVVPTSEGVGIALSISALRGIIERTSYAIGAAAQKYILKGALLVLNGEVMAMVSTDGKRMSIATAVREDGPACSLIIPHKTLDLLATQDSAGNVLFAWSDRHLFFDYGKRQIVSRMIDGEFPNYQKAIPKGNDKTIIVDRLRFAAALRRVGVVAEGVVMSFAPGELSLHSSNAEVGHAQESISIDYQGESFKVNVSWQSIIDFLERASHPTITITAKDSNTHLLLTDGEGFLNVILVMRS